MNQYIKPIIRIIKINQQIKCSKGAVQGATALKLTKKFKIQGKKYLMISKLNWNSPQKTKLLQMRIELKKPFIDNSTCLLSHFAYLGLVKKINVKERKISVKINSIKAILNDIYINSKKVAFMTFLQSINSCMIQIGTMNTVINKRNAMNTIINRRRNKKQRIT